MPTRLQLARNEILDDFNQHPSHVHKSRELKRILAENRERWRLAKSMPFGEFLKYLLKSKKLRRLEFPFPHRNEVRYTWGTVPLEAVLITLKPGCHFSHFTAVQLHELTEQDPRTIYLNHEQSPKPSAALGLAQERIDLAFKRKPRMTSNIASVKGSKRKDVRVCLLNGKHTGYVGVEERTVRGIEKDESISLRLTDIERTLIDIAVRPFYAGGAAEVLKAYGRAAAKVSINRLAATLRKLNYVYPYHQAVGFYLEAAGAYDEKALAFFHEKFEYEFDFYLTYGMEETEYASRWRIYVPKGFIRQAR